MVSLALTWETAWVDYGPVLAVVNLPRCPFRGEAAQPVTTGLGVYTMRQLKMRQLKRGLAAGCKFSVLSAALAGIVGAGAHAMTLQEAVQLTISQNPDIAVVVNNRRAIAHELTQARGLYLPQVDLSAGIGKERTKLVGEVGGPLGALVGILGQRPLQEHVE